MTESSQKIESVFNKFNSVCIVGLSPSPHRPSNQVARYLKENSFAVTGMRPSHSSIDNIPMVSTMSEINSDTAIYAIFRNNDNCVESGKEALENGAKVIWLPIGVHNDELEELCAINGVTYISDLCIKVEHIRYAAHRASERKIPTGN